MPVASLSFRAFNPRPTAALLALALVAAGGSSAGADESSFWTLEPYKIRVLLAVDTQSLPSQEVAAHVADRLVERSDTSIGPLWKMSIDSLDGEQRLAALRGLSEQQLVEFASDPERPLDKLILLTLRETATGLIAHGREYDTLLRRRGPPHETAPCELSSAAEAAFTAIYEAFSPLARFEVETSPENKLERIARVTFRGSQLPQRPGTPRWAEPGDILLPILRRTNREGELTEDGIKVTPWTYLMLDDKTDVGAFTAEIHSHTRYPFVRLKGRVERYALVLPKSDQPTRIHLHVREHPELPLVGYQGFIKDEGDEKTKPIGASNADGMLTIEHGNSDIRMLFIKSGKKVVAKTPVPVGTLDVIAIPLPDERKRLEAEARLSLLQEELLDLIARRAILTTRIETQIELGNKEEAEELIEDLNDMPGYRLFKRKIDTARLQSKAKDPKVDAGIQILFDRTLEVLGAFLDVDQVDKLRAKLYSVPDP